MKALLQVKDVMDDPVCYCISPLVLLVSVGYPLRQSMYTVPALRGTQVSGLLLILIGLHCTIRVRVHAGHLNISCCFSLLRIVSVQVFVRTHLSKS